MEADVPAVIEIAPALLSEAQAARIEPLPCVTDPPALNVMLPACALLPPFSFELETIAPGEERLAPWMDTSPPTVNEMSAPLPSLARFSAYTALPAESVRLPVTTNCIG